MKRFATMLSLSAAALLVAGAASGQIRLNEIRIDQTGADTDEYVEFSGPAGASLSGYHLLVIGDGTPGCGTVEVVIDLAAYSIQADGLFALRFSGGVAQLAGYDATLAGSFENSDNLTFLLVTGNTATTAAPNNDIDTNNDGILDTPRWTTIVDEVAILEDAIPGCGTPQTDDEAVYSGTTVGPDGTFVPGHVYRCGNSWLIGPFDIVGGSDTPGSPNGCPVPVEASTWSRIKSRSN
jgi:hypothetical protein